MAQNSFILWIAVILYALILLILIYSCITGVTVPSLMLLLLLSSFGIFFGVGLGFTRREECAKKIV